MCIDEDCQAGKDDRLAVVLHDWTSAHPVLTSDYGTVTMTRAKSEDPQLWTGVNAEGQTETLTLRGAKMSYSHVVQLEPTSAVGTLTAKGHCKVTK